MIRQLRAWAESYTGRGHFTPVGVIFHWVMAAVMLFQLGFGWWVTWMPVGDGKLQAFQLHSALGLAIFVLAIGRMAWRITVGDPFNDADTQGWKTTFAYIVEHIFYVCFFLLPLSGWAMWSSVAPPGPLAVGGVIPWPQLPLEELPEAMRWQVMDFAEGLHLVLVWVLMLLVPIHVAAALKHHFWDRNDVLEGMLPEIPDWDDPREDPTRKPQARRIPKPSGPG